MPHLTLHRPGIPPGGDWVPRLRSWGLVRVVSGSGYWMASQVNHVLETGSVLVLSGSSGGSVRASSLGPLQLQVFPIDPARLTGLLSLFELQFIESAATRPEFSQRLFASTHPFAAKMSEAIPGLNQNGMLSRMRLVELFLEIFAAALPEFPAKATAAPEARDRLRIFLRQTSTSELIHMSFVELAQVARCTPRHLNRVFREEVKMSFRDKRTELRLDRACELLAQTQSKVVDIALESGYESLSLFNLMFTRRFGVSPGRWRELNQPNKPIGGRRRRPNALSLASV